MKKRPLSSPESEISQVDKQRKMTPEDIAATLKSVHEAVLENSKSLKNIDKNLATLIERTEKNEQAILALKAELGEIEARLNVREQRDLMDNFRMTGFPPFTPSKEEQIELIIKILKYVGVNCTKNDFSYWATYRNKNNTGAAMVRKFASSAKRAEAFKAFREKAKTGEITWNKFVVTGADDPTGARKIYLRSSLTKGTMLLLNKAREHSAKFQYIWESD